MSLRWEINNRVQALKSWARQSFGRDTGGNRPQGTTDSSDRAGGKLKQTGGRVRDTFKR